MGVAGTGKSTVGKLLSQKLGWQFYDGDDFHPLENIEKMRRGIPLDDRDRLPWLLALKDLIEQVRRDRATNNRIFLIHTPRTPIHEPECIDIKYR
jgi:gluconokinase